MYVSLWGAQPTTTYIRMSKNRLKRQVIKYLSINFLKKMDLSGTHYIFFAKASLEEINKTLPVKVNDLGLCSNRF